jgi:small-conductance mechanosensitive channel
MNLSEIRLLETLIIILLVIVVRLLTYKSLKKIQEKFGFQKARILIIKKILSIVFYISSIIVISFIWGVEEKELLLFISSFLTILGIAFFAQWSILSNITASLILYFSYPIKIGDTVTIMEKDYDISGKIMDIGAFFMTLKTVNNEYITIPNSVILQKMIRFK